MKSLFKKIFRKTPGLPAKMEETHTLCLLARPLEGSQLTSKQKTTRTTRKSNRIEVQQPRIWRKNIHPDRYEGWRQGARAERTWCSCGSGGQWIRWSHIHMWQIKAGRDTWGASDPISRPERAAQGSSAGKYSFIISGGCENPVCVGEVE